MCIHGICCFAIANLTARLPSSRKATSISSVCKKCRKNSSNVYRRSRALSPTALMWNGSLRMVSSATSSSFSPNIQSLHRARYLSPTIGTFFPCAPAYSYGLCGHSTFQRLPTAGGLYADIPMKGVSVRIFNLHLILAQPAWRLKEFEMAMAKRNSSVPTIVCGDFNTIEAPHISLLNWILGGRVSDAFFHRRERTNVQESFVQHELVNALAGSITHPISRSQLDHILVSQSFSIKNAEVLPDRIGSDHHPIRVTID